MQRRTRRRHKDAWPPSLRRRLVELLVALLDIATQPGVDHEQLEYLANEADSLLNLIL